MRLKGQIQTSMLGTVVALLLAAGSVQAATGGEDPAADYLRFRRTQVRRHLAGTLDSGVVLLDCGPNLFMVPDHQDWDSLGALVRFAEERLAALSTEERACATGKLGIPRGLIYHSYHPAARVDLQVRLRVREGTVVERRLETVTLGGRVTPLPLATAEEGWQERFTVPFSVREAWRRRLAGEKAVTVEPGYRLLCDGDAEGEEGPTVLRLADSPALPAGEGYRQWLGKGATEAVRRNCRAVIDPGLARPILIRTLARADLAPRERQEGGTLVVEVGPPGHRTTLDPRIHLEVAAFFGVSLPRAAQMVADRYEQSPRPLR